MTGESIRAITVNQGEPDRLAVRHIPFVAARPGELTIRVTAVSLNRGEVKRALSVTPTGACPGWDFAGVVEDGGAGTGALAAGSRVVGLLPVGAWAERVHALRNAVAVIPDGVSDAQAACLPVAGLTALHALRRGGLLLGRKVLVDGASGGVGQFAIQLAAAAGAEVWSHVRQEEHRGVVSASSTGGVIVGETLEAARRHGPFDLIVDGVGGSALSAAMTMLRPRGVCVTFGASEGEVVSFESGGFFRASGASLMSLILGDEIVAGESAADGLALLLRLVERGALNPLIGIEASWTEVGDIARRLIDRRFTGKAVLRIGP